MSDNPGKYPIDPTTNVGQLRAVIGDTASEPFDPPIPGVQNYEMYSDTELEAFLAMSEGSVEGGAFYVYSQMAAAAAMESRSIADFDLKIDLTKRSGDLRAIAQMWKDRWDASTEDIFEVFDIGRGCDCVPELAPRPVCRRGCSGSRLF